MKMFARNRRIRTLKNIRNVEVSPLEKEFLLGPHLFNYARKQCNAVTDYSIYSVYCVQYTRKQYNVVTKYTVRVL